MDKMRIGTTAEAKAAADQQHRAATRPCGSSGQDNSTCCENTCGIDFATCQAAMLGAIFFLAFTAFQMEQNFAGKLYGEVRSSL